MPRYFVQTWGCQMNELDSARFGGQLTSRGWEPAETANEADLVLLNTCSVREKAEEKVRSALGQLARLRERRPNLLIGVAGCVAQQEGRAFLEGENRVDFVLGTGNVERLLSTIEETLAKSSPVVHLEFDDLPFSFETIRRDNPAQAMVTIIEGCNMYCTFCVVPFTRGSERSRPAAAVVREIEGLVERGTREVLLLGQTINAYRDPDHGEGFAELLRRVAKVPELSRLRFITSHPSFWTDDLTAVIADHGEVICPYIHLPPQAGSDKILSRMKRRYTRGEYLSVIRGIRDAVPHVALSGDVIVGFPGETEQDFLETMTLVEEVEFSSLYSFAYSTRPGTAAARWEDHVSVSEKKDRLRRLQDLQDRIQGERNQALIGSTMEVLVEGSSKKGNQLSGRDRWNRVVNFTPSVPVSSGDTVQVSITKAFPHSLLGTA